MQLEDVYGEIYRVLKPGGYFVSYEWVSTKLYDKTNKEHVRIIDEINFGNGLPVSAHQPHPCTLHGSQPPDTPPQVGGTRRGGMAAPLALSRGRAAYQILCGMTARSLSEEHELISFCALQAWCCAGPRPSVGPPSSGLRPSVGPPPLALGQA